MQSKGHAGIKSAVFQQPGVRFLDAIQVLKNGPLGHEKPEMWLWLQRGGDFDVAGWLRAGELGGWELKTLVFTMF